MLEHNYYKLFEIERTRGQRKKLVFPGPRLLRFATRPRRFELPTFSLGGYCSIQTELRAQYSRPQLTLLLLLK